jgi:hypothetical protein
MTTVFDLLNHAAMMNGRSNRTYGSLAEQLKNNKASEQQIHEQRKSQWGMNYQEAAIYDEIVASDRARLLRFG